MDENPDDRSLLYMLAAARLANDKAKGLADALTWARQQLTDFAATPGEPPSTDPPKPVSAADVRIALRNVWSD